MRSSFRILLGLVVTTVMFTAGQVLAEDDRMVEEETTTTTTTQQQGTVSQISPNTIVIRPMNAPNPVTYGFTSSTIYVDESGAPVAIENVRPGSPVVVYHDQAVGGKTTATKVVVKKRTIEEDD